MAKKEFDELLKSLDSSKPSVDWEQKKKAWVEEIEKFFELVKAFLKEYVEKEKVKLMPGKTHISEELLGEYEAPTLEIDFASKRVKFVPVGLHVIGAAGRIDLIGPNGEVLFLRVGKSHSKPNIMVQIVLPEETPKPIPQTQESDLTWKIASPPPGVRFTDLNEDTFFSSLTEVING